jgi:hypothetical protein
MPKKKEFTTRQTSFFNKEIPKMLKVYYFSGPNPNLCRGVNSKQGFWMGLVPKELKS